jgi:hypothetical protein
MDRKKETKMALKLRNITGKQLRTCYFCLRHQRGNYNKALSMCSSLDSEGDRQAA